MHSILNAQPTPKTSANSPAASKKRVVWSIHETAEALGRPRDQLLMWLRAGMPYVTAGSWETGDGFHLCPAWTIDWYITTKAVVQASGSSHIAQQPGIS